MSRRLISFLVAFVSILFVGDRAWNRDLREASIFAQIAGFQRFVDELPIPPRIQIQGNPAPDLNITLNQFKAKVHRDLPETLEWGYNGSSPGPTIEVESGQFLRIHWQSQLPTTHVLATPQGADTVDGNGQPLPDVRNVTHLHGAVVTEPDPLDRLKNNDGWPDTWMVPGQEQVAEYPNQQSARTLWYHDHAMGETGRNVAAGLQGLYIIHDDYERSLNLPSGSFDVPLIFNGRAVNSDGSLFYSSSIAIELYGNAVSVNGKLWPYMNVEPRKYRFRMINTSNARTFGMKLIDQADQSSGPAFYQIGSDGGFLETTTVLDDPTHANSPRLVLAPAERADVIIDFSQSAGHTFLLHNNSWDPGDNELLLPQMMLFKVQAAVSGADTSQIPLHMQPIRRMAPSEAAATRQIALGQMLMADGTPMMMLNNKSWHDPISEQPVLGTTEIWEIVNTLPDVHPFHIHLVNFQVLDRTPFDVDSYLNDGKVQLTGPAAPPDPNEMGWKDTVRVTGNTVTRLIMTFAPYAGFYVYHCHILEHEDMDMMRPFQVVPPAR